MADTKKSEDIGVGIDLGTMNLVAARKMNKKIIHTRVRDAFLDLPLEHKRMLKFSNTDFIEMEGKLLVIGDKALETANLFNREVRRPMTQGVLAAGEIDAQRVMALMMKKILGEPRTEKEKCCYSVPATAVDVLGSDITYHKAILGKILSELGYDPEPTNEALAIIFAECMKENFSGVALSFGSGMTNVCLAFNAMNALEFSLGKGGDYIDNGAARAVSSTAGKMCSIKEGGIDLTSPKNREEEAIALFVQTLIDYTIQNFTQHFSKAKKEILIPKPIPIIISGGTSLAGGFLEKFKEQFESHRAKFPIQISEIRAASDPMNAVATGLLMQAQMD
jgi:hypothetical protein